MKLLWVCFLAVALLGCLVEAQPHLKPSDPQGPPPTSPQKPSDPQRPRPPIPQKPSDPQRPRPPIPQKPSDPQRPRPPMPQKPSDPQPPMPQKPSDPQRPRPPIPQKPSDPQRPLPQRPKPLPQRPSDPQHPNTSPPHQGPKKPDDPSYVSPPDFHSCEVSAHEKIQCGVPSISATECEAINCCFDGRMCYYGKFVTLQCTKDGLFILVISRDATLPRIDLDRLSFYGSGQECEPVGITSSFVIFQFPVTACGTYMTEHSHLAERSLFYENMLYSSYEVSEGNRGYITRDTRFDLFIQCRYIGTTVEALVTEVYPVPPPNPVAAFGPLYVWLRLGSGTCAIKGCVEEDVAYNSFHVDADYPITKVLREPVYVEVEMLDRTDPNIVLTLGRCWATADPNPYSLPQWELLTDGCPFAGDNYQTKLLKATDVLHPGHHRRFVFKMFTFMETGHSAPSKKIKADSEPAAFPSRQLVYIHCNTSVCQPTFANNCEPRCFRKRREIAASFHKRFRPETTSVHSQAIEITADN